MTAMPPTQTCLHCGTPVKKTEARELFCCAGCEYVYQLIHQSGLDRFYDLQGGLSQPAASTVFQERDYLWLKESMVELEKTEKEDVEAHFSIQGISCVGCVWLLEKVYKQSEGAISCGIDSSAGEMTLRWKRGKADLVRFAKRIQGFGYLLGSRSKEPQRESRRLVGRLGLCAAFSMNAMLFAIPTYLGMEKTFEYAPLFARLLLVFSTLSIFVGGSYFLKRCWEGLRNRVFHIDIPIGLGIGIAYLSSVVAWSHHRVDFLYLEFVSTFTFLMLLGRWVHLKAVEENRDRLLKEEETLHFVWNEGSDEKIPNDEIQSGTRYRIMSGAAVPVKSILLSEVGTFGMDWISGETDLRTWRQGEIIPAGALSLRSDSLLMEAQEPWEDSLLKSLLEIQGTKSNRNDTLEKFIRGYLIVILFVGFFAGVGWYWKTGNPFRALQVVTSILVVSCPCASGVALPMIDDRAAIRLRRMGVYLRESTLWHRLLRVKKLVFDKTGTLTMESLEMENAEALRSLGLEDQKSLFTLIRSSLHPVSNALRKELLALNPSFDQMPVFEGVSEVVGKGMEMRVHGVLHRLGRGEWATGTPTSTTVWSRDGAVILEMKFSEKIREEASTMVQEFQGRGYEIYLLSGDRREKVGAMGRRLGIRDENVYSELSPVEKEEWFKKNSHSDTLMLGDGANDSLAFNRSYCAGTPAIDRGFLQKKADFYWMGKSLRGIVGLFDTAILRQKSIRRVVGFAIVYNLFAVGISVCGWMSPVLASILMPSSSLVTLMIAVMSLPIRFKK
jgi:Cu2+-exporting ATPase